tara:strand:+ start:6565 stop:7083 length:519 start_codon:yes stop_codon:yes gene_type:complete
MKKIIVILFITFCGRNYAQDQYPKIVNFQISNKTINDKNESIWASTLYHFLILNPHKAIDLKQFGNTESEFSIVSTNSNKVLLAFNQPSKLISKGRCAAGLEKGFVYLELNSDLEVIKDDIFLTESCLWLIETTSEHHLNSDSISYNIENIPTSEAYAIIINTKETTIIKTY